MLKVSVFFLAVALIGCGKTQRSSPSPFLHKRDGKKWEERVELKDSLPPQAPDKQFDFKARKLEEGNTETVSKAGLVAAINRYLEDRGSFSAVVEAVENGADVNMLVPFSYDGMSSEKKIPLIHYVYSRGRFLKDEEGPFEREDRIFELFLKYKLGVNARGYSGHTLLLNALINSQVQGVSPDRTIRVVRALLEKGADPRLQGFCGNKEHTPLSLLESFFYLGEEEWDRNHFFEVQHLILKAMGEDVSVVELRRRRASKEKATTRPIQAYLNLMHAVFYGATNDELKTIVRDGADLNQRINGDPALFQAIVLAISDPEKANVAEFLIRSGADLDALGERTFLGYSALHVALISIAIGPRNVETEAIFSSQRKVIQLLLDYGSDPNVKLKQGIDTRTALEQIEVTRPFGVFTEERKKELIAAFKIAIGRSEKERKQFRENALKQEVGGNGKD